MILKAFNKQKTIKQDTYKLLINSSNASSLAYCFIDNIKYKVSSLLLNQILK